MALPALGVSPLYEVLAADEKQLPPLLEKGWFCVGETFCLLSSMDLAWTKANSFLSEKKKTDRPFSFL